MDYSDEELVRKAIRERETIYLPRYSLELNPAETLWCILKGEWIRLVDYNTKDSFFYCINSALTSVGTNLFVNCSYV